jgi:hypothetical protein
MVREPVEVGDIAEAFKLFDRDRYVGVRIASVT